MSEFKVNLTAVNPKEESRRTPPVEALVDTGAHSSWLPRRLLLDAGITPRGKVQFQMANNQLIEREVGYAILSAEGYSTNDEVVFAEDGDMNLLGGAHKVGRRTLEGFKVMVDNIGHRFVALAAVSCPANTAVSAKDGKQ